MTSTIPSVEQSAEDLTARLGVVYGYDVLDVLHRDTDVEPARVYNNDYIGQARDQKRRDKQHRGQLPQRDGEIREQPWADRIVGQPRILEEGIWTNTELDERERYWIETLKPRLNHDLNLGNPARIPIPVQQRERDARDKAKGLQARDWSRPPRPAAAPVVDFRRARPAPAQRRPAPARPGSQRPSRLGRWAERRTRRLRKQTIAVLQAAAVLVAVWVALGGALLVWTDTAGRDSAGIAAVGTAGLFALWRKIIK